MADFFLPRVGELGLSAVNPGLPRIPDRRNCPRVFSRAPANSYYLRPRSPLGTDVDQSVSYFLGGGLLPPCPFPGFSFGPSMRITSLLSFDECFRNQIGADEEMTITDKER